MSVGLDSTTVVPMLIVQMVLVTLYASAELDMMAMELTAVSDYCVCAHCYW